MSERCEYDHSHLSYHQPCYICGLSLPRSLRKKCPYAALRTLADAVKRIKDDYYPSSYREAELALDEMREALDAAYRAAQPEQPE